MLPSTIRRFGRYRSSPPEGDFARKSHHFSRFSVKACAGTFAPQPGYRSGIFNRGWAMSQTYIIEVSSQAAGIVVRSPEGYIFFAASHRFNQLDGKVFRNAREAERAARRIAIGDGALAA
jgi:hypothetical protein